MLILGIGVNAAERGFIGAFWKICGLIPGRVTNRGVFLIPFFTGLSTVVTVVVAAVTPFFVCVVPAVTVRVFRFDFRFERMRF